jgi:hypothetical protein
MLRASDAAVSVHSVTCRLPEQSNWRPHPSARQWSIGLVSPGTWRSAITIWSAGHEILVEDALCNSGTTDWKVVAHETLSVTNVAANNFFIFVSWTVRWQF